MKVKKEKTRAILERDSASYVEYNNPDDAQINYERFWMVKRLFGIPIYRKRFRQNSVIKSKTGLKKTGFK